jgi:hypothetical protein
VAWNAFKKLFVLNLNMILIDGKENQIKSNYFFFFFVQSSESGWQGVHPWTRRLSTSLGNSFTTLALEHRRMFWPRSARKPDLTGPKETQQGATGEEKDLLALAPFPYLVRSHTFSFHFYRCLNKTPFRRSNSRRLGELIFFLLLLSPLTLGISINADKICRGQSTDLLECKRWAFVREKKKNCPSTTFI